MPASFRTALSWLDRLEQSARSCGNCLCVGLDPRFEPGLEAGRQRIDELLAGLQGQKVAPAAFKPNLAYFEQFGSAGILWLESLLPRLRALAPVILDAKRGDIGASSAAYARAMFETWNGDALTVSPWMGEDSLSPFWDYCPERGVYVLLHTSNPGAADFQHLSLAGGEPLWGRLRARLSGDWYRPGLGAVAGATRPEALAELVGSLDRPFPLLVPGVGSQGGEADRVREALGEQRVWARVNVSSGILYAQRPLEAFLGYAEALTIS